MIGIGQRPWLMEASLGLLRQRRGEQRVKPRGQACAPGAQRRHVGVQMLLVSFGRRAALEHGMPGEQAVGHRTQSVDIGIGIDPAIQDLFRGTGLIVVVQGERPPIFVAQLNHPPQPKIRDDHTTIRLQVDAVGAQAAMQCGMLVGILQRAGDLIQIAPDR